MAFVGNFTLLGGPTRGIGQKSRQQGSTCRCAATEAGPSAADSAAALMRLYDAEAFSKDTVDYVDETWSNWRWHYPTAYSFCTGRAPPTPYVRILDAGCSGGLSTESLVRSNPGAEVLAIDVSTASLRRTEDRLLGRIGLQGLSRVRLAQKNVEDLRQLDGTFDMINCVGFLHYTPDPAATMKELAAKLKPGGIMHVFLHAIDGRREVTSMQRAAEILKGGPLEFKESVAIGKRVMSALPEDSPLRVASSDRLAADTFKDPSFAEMFQQPHYTFESIFELVDESGLQFCGVSNPETFDLSRVLADDLPLLLKAMSLPLREQFQLFELLEPKSVTHFEFFLRNDTGTPTDWSDPKYLRRAGAVLNPCIRGFPSRLVVDTKHHLYELSDEEVVFIKLLGVAVFIGNAMDAAGVGSSQVRRLIEDKIILAKPARY